MRRISRRERNLLILTIAVVLIALTQIALVRPATRKIRRLRTKAALSVQVLARVRSTLDRKDAVETSYEEIRNRITSSKGSAREIIDMLLAIETAAKDSGVEILENVHRDDRPFEYFSRHTVGFRGRGKLQNLTRMLYALQDPELLLKIPEMRFAMRNHQLEMELEITRIVYTSDHENDV